MIIGKEKIKNENGEETYICIYKDEPHIYTKNHNIKFEIQNKN